MTINEAIYAVLDGVNISTDDFPVHRRFIYNELKNARSELIKQELNKNVLLDDNSMQTITCFKLERTDAAMCGNYDSGDFILRSVKRLPETITYDGGTAVFPFMMNGTRIFATDKDAWARRSRKRFKMPDAFGYYIENGHIIVIGYDDIEELDISISGHYKDPEIAYVLSETDECIEGRCKPVYILPFICPAHIERRVVEIAKASALRKLNVPSDNSNNAQFDPNVKSKN